MYEYNARDVVLVDGDTFHVTVDLGLDVSVRTTVRVYGINCPEMSTPAGRDAKVFAVDWLAAQVALGPLSVRTVKDKREKYGRYLADLRGVGGVSLAADLVSAGHAVPYFP